MMEEDIFDKVLKNIKERRLTYMQDFFERYSVHEDEDDEDDVVDFETMSIIRKPNGPYPKIPEFGELTSYNVGHENELFEEISQSLLGGKKKGNSAKIGENNSQQILKSPKKRSEDDQLSMHSPCRSVHSSKLSKNETIMNDFNPTVEDLEVLPLFTLQFSFESLHDKSDESDSETSSDISDCEYDSIGEKDSSLNENFCQAAKDISVPGKSKRVNNEKIIECTKFETRVYLKRLSIDEINCATSANKNKALAPFQSLSTLNNFSDNNYNTGNIDVLSVVNSPSFSANYIARTTRSRKSEICNNKSSISERYSTNNVDICKLALPRNRKNNIIGNKTLKYKEISDISSIIYNNIKNPQNFKILLKELQNIIKNPVMLKKDFIFQCCNKITQIDGTLFPFISDRGSGKAGYQSIFCDTKCVSRKVYKVKHNNDKNCEKKSKKYLTDTPYVLNKNASALIEKIEEIPAKSPKRKFSTILPLPSLDSVLQLENHNPRKMQRISSHMNHELHYKKETQKIDSLIAREAKRKTEENSANRNCSAIESLPSSDLKSQLENCSPRELQNSSHMNRYLHYKTEKTVHNVSREAKEKIEKKSAKSPNRKCSAIVSLPSSGSIPQLENYSPHKLQRISSCMNRDLRYKKETRITVDHVSRETREGCFEKQSQKCDNLHATTISNGSLKKKNKHDYNSVIVPLDSLSLHKTWKCNYYY